MRKDKSRLHRLRALVEKALKLVDGQFELTEFVIAHPEHVAGQQILVRPPATFCRRNRRGLKFPRTQLTNP